MLKLHHVKHPPTGRNHFCGPSALSILTGLDTGRCAALLRRVGGRARIKGAYHSEMRTALRELGIETMTSHWPIGGKPTLVQWSRNTRATRGDGTFLITVGNHYAVVQGRRFACGWTKKPIPLGQAPKRRRRVTAVWSLVKLREVKVNEVAPPVVRKPDTERNDRQRAKALAAQHGIEIDNDREATGNGGYLWVYPPACLHDEYGEMCDDPYDAHNHDTWGEVLTAVETYAKLVEARVNTPVPSRVDTLVETIPLDIPVPSATVLA